jgi:phosphoglycolate phosphatase-like HAD superfamily hydrolase
MAERFDLIVFDWDGTLMDSAGAIVRAMQAATRRASGRARALRDRPRAG